MNNQEAIKILGQYDVSDLHFYTTDGEEIPFAEWSDAIETAISALQAQDSKIRKICKTCKHDLPSKKWPCVDCDMREPADRWESHDVLDTNVGGMISRKAAIDALMDEFKRVPTTAIRAKNRIDSLSSAQLQYEELTPEEAAAEIARGSIRSAMYWFDVMIRLKQMGYAICREK